MVTTLGIAFSNLFVRTCRVLLQTTLECLSRIGVAIKHFSHIAKASSAQKTPAVFIAQGTQTVRPDRHVLVHFAASNHCTGKRACALTQAACSQNSTQEGFRWQLAQNSGDELALGLEPAVHARAPNSARRRPSMEHELRTDGRHDLANASSRNAHKLQTVHIKQCAKTTFMCSASTCLTQCANVRKHAHPNKCTCGLCEEYSERGRRQAYSKSMQRCPHTARGEQVCVL